MRILMAVAVVLLAAAPKAAKKPALTRAPRPPASAASAPDLAALVIVETELRPTVDYQAEVYAGVPLDDRYAKERGFDKGLVSMVFEKQRRIAFRVPRGTIKKRVRFAAGARDRLDVIDTEDGFIVVDTTTTSAGIFTTSDVYVFPRSSSLQQRVAMLAAVPPIPRERVRQALVAF
jgi:hypothetical protein